MEPGIPQSRERRRCRSAVPESVTRKKTKDHGRGTWLGKAPSGAPELASAAIEQFSQTRRKAEPQRVATARSQAMVCATQEDKKQAAATRSVGSQTSTLTTDVEPCSSGAPFTQRIGWNHNDYNTEITSSLKTSVMRSQVQRDASQQTTSRDHTFGSAPSHATWTLWAAAAAQNPHWASNRQVTTESLSPVACAAPTGRHHQSELQSPERSVKQGRTSPLALVAAPRPAAPQHYKRKNKDQKTFRAHRTEVEGTPGERLWRTLPPPRRACGSSLRIVCVVNVERKSIPQPVIEK